MSSPSFLLFDCIFLVPQSPPCPHVSTIVCHVGSCHRTFTPIPTFLHNHHNLCDPQRKNHPLGETHSDCFSQPLDFMSPSSPSPMVSITYVLLCHQAAVTPVLFLVTGPWAGHLRVSLTVHRQTVNLPEFVWSFIFLSLGMLKKKIYVDGNSILRDPLQKTYQIMLTWNALALGAGRGTLPPNV